MSSKKPLYAPVTSWNGIFFTSGQLPIDPETKKASDDFKEQVRQSLANVLNIIEIEGGNKEKIIKMNIFLSDINNFSAMNEVYEEFFEGVNCPSRTALEVGNIPTGAMVEIEAIFHV